MDKNIKKITIVGGSGTGKTTLAENISKETGIETYHLDGLNYYANWKPRDKDERDKMIRNIIKKDEWIIDGTYTSTIDERFAASDIIIYLDYTTMAQVRGVLKRIIKHGGKEKKEIPRMQGRISLGFFLLGNKMEKGKTPSYY